jgi:hypothetical protein
MNTYGIVLFYTNSASMRAEKVLSEEKLNVKLIPTPRDLSSDCGVALRFDWDQLDRVRTLMNAKGVENAGIHKISDNLSPN